MAAKNRGLGTGLSALFGSAADFQDTAAGFEYIAVSKIEPNRAQPRTVFDNDMLAELAESIRTHGVLTPLLVRKTGDVYQIIAGERRWRASRLAGLSEVPVRVIDVDDRTAAEMSLVENLQREDLNPIEEALGYKTLIDEYGLTQEQIAEAMSKSRPLIANAMRLLKLPDAVIEMVRDGSLAAGSARALLSIPDEADKIRAAEEIVRRGLSSREAEKLAKKCIQNSAEKRKTTVPAVAFDYSGLENSLSETLSRRVKILPGKKNTGKFEIEYYGVDDFEVLYNALMDISEGKGRGGEK